MAATMVPIAPEAYRCEFLSSQLDFPVLSVVDNLVKVSVAALGVYPHARYGFVSFTQRDYDQIRRNFENDEMGFKPYLTYGHLRNLNADGGNPAEGFLQGLAQEGRILYGYFQPRTLQVLADVRDERYVNSSGEILRNWLSKYGRGNVGTALSAVALTNEPFVPGMPNAKVVGREGRVWAVVQTLSNEALEVNHLNVADAETDPTEIAATLDALKAGTYLPNQPASLRLEDVLDYMTRSVWGTHPLLPEPSCEEMSSMLTPVTPADPAAATTPVETLSNGPANSQGPASSMPSGEPSASWLMNNVLSPLLQKFSLGGASAEMKDAPAASATIESTQPDEALSNPAAVEAPPTAATPKEEAPMNPEQLQELLSNAVKQAVAEANTANAALIEKQNATIETLSNTVTSLQEATTNSIAMAQRLSNDAKMTTREAKLNELVAGGIPASMVGKTRELLSMVDAAEGNVEKLSNDGKSVSLESAVLGILNALPVEMRMRYEQVQGQMLSTEAMPAVNPWSDEMAQLDKGLAAQKLSIDKDLDHAGGNAYNDPLAETLSLGLRLPA